MTHTACLRAQAFCEEYGLRTPVLMAPMAGACPAPLAAAVANAGGMGACGALVMKPDAIADWAATYRARSNGSFQMNLWIPDPAPVRDALNEAAVTEFLSQFGPAPDVAAADAPMLDFDAQCEAMLAAGPAAISSIMGVYPPSFVERMKERGIKWFATVTTVAEAREVEAAGADVIVAQGAEAGGHRGAFNAEAAETAMVGLFSLLPAVVDAVDLPVVATGGIADGRTAAAALVLGASAVQVGTALLRSPEAETPAAWADALGKAAPEDTTPTRAFSGRFGRSLRNDYTEAARTAATPRPAPYPVQRALTGEMRKAAAEAGDIQRMQAWAGQSAGLSKAAPASEIVTEIWEDAQAILNGQAHT